MKRIARALLGLLLTLLVLALIVPWLLPRPGMEGAIPDRPFPDSRFAEVDGVRLHWRQRDGDRHDSRPLVVLLHGFGGSSFSWRHTLDALERAGFDAIAPDLPPFGYSERTGTGPGWSELVGALADRSRTDGPVIWVGHSMGAAVASDAASTRPARASALVLVAGAPAMRQRPSAWYELARIPSFARAAEAWAASRLIGEDRVRSMLESAFGRAPAPEELDGYRAPLTVPGTYPALLRRLRLEPTGPDPQDLPRPAHIIWGEFDRWVPRARGDAVVAARPDIGPIRIIPGAGHNPMDTHADEFNRMLLELIRDREPGALG